MRKLDRPVCPAALGPGSRGAQELQRAYDHFVTNGEIDGFEFDAYSDKSVKAALYEMSGGMCAYCEAEYDVTEPVDVEHYRPKGRLDTDAGKLKPAYWWLAADWSNLLPSCIHCNRASEQVLYDGSSLMMGKADRFPLLDEAKRATAQGGEANETPLLLDPSRDRPSDFLRFVEEDRRCIVVPVGDDLTQLDALRGRTSIDVYGLNRRGLVKARSRYWRRIKFALARVAQLAHDLDAGPAGEERESIENNLVDELEFLREHVDGSDCYTGMAATLIEPELARLGLHL